jgi:N-acetylglucosaminyldiphosphoundecaprenol N-acetyl-beta-D-mannosaminyltransferase
MSSTRFFKLARAFAPQRSGRITFMNPYSWLVNRSRGDRDLDEFTIYADGILLVWLYNLACGARIQRAAFDFSSVAGQVFADAEATARSVFLIGGRDGVSAQAAGVIRRRHPKLVLAGTRSGYLRDDAERLDALQDAARADIVIAGMGAPAQETFVADLWRRGWRGAGYTCGGFMDQIIGTDGDYFPPWSNRWHLRWLYRLAKEPRRLWKRYLIDYPRFVLTFVADCVRLGVRRSREA